MSVLVTDAGFATAAPAPEALELTPEDDLAEVAGRLEAATLVRIAFPSFADGRGFTLARRLRRMGYSGRLRAVGPLLADQYAMARRVGFDEVEIPDALAARQPEEQWLFRADWRSHDHQARLRSGPHAPVSGETP